MYQKNLGEGKTNYSRLEVRQLGSLELENKKARRQEGWLLSVSGVHGICHSEAKPKNLLKVMRSFALLRMTKNLNLQAANLLNCQASQQRKAAFTLAEGATHVAICNSKRKTAFTLAEVLITLAVIGVVAAITMPMLISNINERVNSERQANIVYKVTQAMEHMRASGKLTAYDSTESFVNELQKHLKIQKICDKDHLTECWPTDTVKGGDDKTYNISELKSGYSLLLKSNTNNVGLILADGASLILNYDTTFKGMDIGDEVIASSVGLPVGNNKSRVFEYTTNVTSPVAFIMDVNGKKGPNSETKDDKYYDIRSFNGARLSFVCENGNAGCIYYVGTSYSTIDCADTSSELYSYCQDHPSGWSNDGWAGAKYKCDFMGMDLPSIAQMQSIYSNKSEYPSIAGSTDKFWTNEEYPYYTPNTPYTAGIYFDYNNGESHGTPKSSTKAKVICLAR